MDGLKGGGSAGDDADGGGANFLARPYHAYSRHVQRILDQVTPYHLARWSTCLGLLVFFMYRVVVLQGFYIVAYVLGIFLLNQFILFLTPAVVSDLDADDYYDDDGETRLPTRSDEEFRPFMRRLPEFKFCVFDIPVFWPILVMYFIVLFLVTMKRQIRHMIKHRYVPFSYGKVRYQGKQANSTTNASASSSSATFNAKLSK